MSQRREHAKLIRFTNEELETVNDRARACGRPVACYIREVALGGKPRMTSAPLTPAVIRQLARLAMRLRGLTATASERALPEAAEYAASVDDVLDLIHLLD